MNCGHGWRRVLAGLLGTVAALLLGACATVPGTNTKVPGAGTIDTAPDPWENWNRKVFSFNESLDRNVLKPVAQTYHDVVPSLVRTGVDNVLGNLYDVWSTANNFLQGKLQTGLEMGMRVLTNTFFGLGGLFDPATEVGLKRRQEDFGQTLGRWGVANGPYLVLPLFGPSTLRDTAGLVVDRQFAPSTLADTTAGTYGIAAIEVVDRRSNLLATGSLIDQVALDKYVFLRDAYLSQRRDALYDGAPPMETFEDDGADAPARPASAPASAAAAPAAAPASAAAAASAPAK